MREFLIGLNSWAVLAVAIIGIGGGFVLMFYGLVTHHDVRWWPIPLLVVGFLAMVIVQGNAMARDDLWKDD